MDLRITIWAKIVTIKTGKYSKQELPLQGISRRTAGVHFGTGINTLSINSKLPLMAGNNNYQIKLIRHLSNHMKGYCEANCSGFQV
jgi:hypothetical protein